MKLIVRIEAGQKRTDAKMVELAEAQLKTDRKLEKLIDLWQRRTPNGRG
jgi:hypothetical protein